MFCYLSDDKLGKAEESLVHRKNIKSVKLFDCNTPRTYN